MKFHGRLREEPRGKPRHMATYFRSCLLHFARVYHFHGTGNRRGGEREKRKKRKRERLGCQTYCQRTGNGLEIAPTVAFNRPSLITLEFLSLSLFSFPTNRARVIHRLFIYIYTHLPPLFTKKIERKNRDSVDIHRS